MPFRRTAVVAATTTQSRSTQWRSHWVDERRPAPEARQARPAHGASLKVYASSRVRSCLIFEARVTVDAKNELKHARLVLGGSRGRGPAARRVRSARTATSGSSTNSARLTQISHARPSRSR